MINNTYPWTESTWIQIPSYVKVFINGDKISFEKPDKKVVCRIDKDTNAEIIKEMTLNPILKDTIPSKETLNQLVEMGFVIEGKNPAQVQAESFHMETSYPYNKGGKYTESQIEEMQYQAQKRRFSSEVTGEKQIDIPQQMHRKRSMPTNSLLDDLVDTGEETIEKILFSLHSQQNKLYPSAGALYPINIYIENKYKGINRLYKFDSITGKVINQEIGVSVDKNVFFDPLLEGAKTRVWLCADIENTTYKYGARGYRYALLESGHAAQVIIQLLNNNGYECRPFGGFNDIQASEHLDLTNEIVTYVIGAYKSEDTVEKKMAFS